MQAGYDNGVRSWVLWNPSSSYTLRALRPAILTEGEEAPNRRTVKADSGRVAPPAADTLKPSPVPPPR
jgi:hypothetical protein